MEVILTWKLKLIGKRIIEEVGVLRESSHQFERFYENWRWPRELEMKFVRRNEEFRRVFIGLRQNVIFFVKIFANPPLYPTTAIGFDMGLCLGTGLDGHRHARATWACGPDCWPRHSLAWPHSWAGPSLSPLCLAQHFARGRVRLSVRMGRPGHQSPELNQHYPKFVSKCCF